MLDIDSYFGDWSDQYLVKLTLVAVAILLVISVIGASAVVTANDSVRENTREELRTTNQLQSAQINQWALNLKRQTRLLSQAEVIKSRDRSQIPTYLDASLEDDQGLGEGVVAIHYVTLGTFETESKIRNSTDDDLVGANPREENLSWVDSSFSDPSDVSITKPYASPVSSDPAVAFTSPVAGQANRAIVVVVDARTVSETFLGDPGAGGLAAIVAEDGTIMFSTETTHIGRDVSEVGFLQSDLMGPSLASQTYTEDISFEGSAQATSVSPLSNFGWTSVTQVPQSTAFTLSNSIRNMILMLLGTVGLGFVVFFGIISRGAIADIRELSEKAERVAETDGNADIDLETDRGDEIGTLFRSVDSMQSTLDRQIRERIEELEVVNADLEDLTEDMSEAADEQRAVMQRCADGDLRKRMDTGTNVEQLDELARNFNGMMDDIQTSLQETTTFAETVGATSEEVTASAEEVQSASERVTNSIQQISDGAERQNERFEAVSSEMENLSSTTEEIASMSNQVSTLADETIETGQEGREDAQRAIEGMSELTDDVDEAVDAINALEEEAKHIDELVDFINEVADRTNILALNANIEAARAGEAGEGFSVVAEEIKDLAAESKEATEDIEARLRQIESETDRTSEVVQTTAQSVTEQTEIVRDAAEALGEVATYAEETGEGVQEISETTEEQAATTQEVVAMVAEATTESQQTADESEKVAAAAEEQTAAMSEVAESVNELSLQADQLNQALDRFTVDEGGPSADVDEAVVPDFEDDDEPLDAGGDDEPPGSVDDDGGPGSDELVDDPDVERDDDATGDDDAAAVDDEDVPTEEPDGTLEHDD